MHDVIDIEGSFFAGASIPRLRTKLSTDRQHLGTVTQAAESLFRVHLYHRRSGAPQWAGTWWTEVEHPSLTDTLESADALLRERLSTNSNSP